MSSRPAVVLHIPHASSVIPAAVREQFVLSEEELGAELLAMTDAHTAQLFDAIRPRVASIAFPVSRLVVDPERFVSDADEPMSRIGMGVVYTRTSDGHALRRSLSYAEHTALINSYYAPHHRTLTDANAPLVDSNADTAVYRGAITWLDRLETGGSCYCVL